MKHPKIIVAGIGPGNESDITPAVISALQESDVVVGYKYYFQFVTPYLHPSTKMCIRDRTMGTRATISLGDENLDPEHSNYYSINMEYRTNRFSASVTGYLNYVKNMVTSKSTKFDDLPEAEQNQLREEFPEIGDLSSTKKLSVKNYFNFEKATVKGFEVNLNGNLFPGFTLAGNYTYAYGLSLIHI